MALPTQRVDLHDFQGYSSYGSDLEQDPRILVGALNIETDEQGIIRKRRGVTSAVISGFVPGTINLLYSFESQQDFTGPTARWTVLILDMSLLSHMTSLC